MENALLRCVARFAGQIHLTSLSQSFYFKLNVKKINKKLFAHASVTSFRCNILQYKLIDMIRMYGRMFFKEKYTVLSLAIKPTHEENHIIRTTNPFT